MTSRRGKRREEEEKEEDRSGLTNEEERRRRYCPSKSVGDVSSKWKVVQAGKERKVPVNAGAEANVAG